MRTEKQLIREWRAGARLLGYDVERSAFISSDAVHFLFLVYFREFGDGYGGRYGFLDYVVHALELPVRMRSLRKGRWSGGLPEFYRGLAKRHEDEERVRNRKRRNKK